MECSSQYLTIELQVCLSLFRWNKWKSSIYSIENERKKERKKESVKDKEMKTKRLTVYLIVNCNSLIEICFVFLYE